MKRLERDIDYILDTLREAKASGGATLLIGAGCSKSAGIPLAPEIVADIEGRYPNKVRRLKEKSYHACMRELAVNERQRLIKGYIDQAKINWAHIGIAHLMKEGYVSRVLTTNFDPLVLRACALLQLFPAVYDIAVSDSFKPDRISDPSIFYLHGQHTGFVQIHTQEQFNAMFKKLEPVFTDAMRNRPWIVVGYSGETDPVFEHLTCVPCFDNHLYWICYQDNDPGKDIREKLLVEGKDAFYCKGYHADSFFIKLSQQLGNFPPTFLSKPFTYLEQQMDMLTPFTVAEELGFTNFADSARNLIRKAINDLERGDTDDEEAASSAKALNVSTVFAAGKYDDLIALDTPGATLSPEYIIYIAWAYNMKGIEEAKIGKGRTGVDADESFAAAYRYYERAYTIMPNIYATLVNWGIALTNHAKQKTGAEAEALFQQAGEKYVAAVAIRPDDANTLNNWGNALLVQVSRKTLAERDDLLHAAREKCVLAEKISPGSGAYNLACIESMCNNPEVCRSFLESAKVHGTLPNRAHLEADTDLDNVRACSWFKDFIESLPQEEVVVA